MRADGKPRDGSAFGPLTPPAAAHGLQLRRWMILWSLGALVLAATALVVLRRSDVADFVALAEQARPAWLVAALLFQAATYACAAAVWWLVLRRLGHRLSLPRLIPLGLAKLFADEAMPTAGISGSLLVVAALGRRGVPGPVALATFFFGVGSFFLALAIAALVGLVLVGSARPVPRALVLAVLGLIAVLAGIAALLPWALSHRRDTVAALFRRWPAVLELIEAAVRALRGLLAAPGLLAAATGVQLLLRVLDGMTLWCCFKALGVPVPYATAFAGVALGSVAMFVVPLPMGLGVFEVGSVAALTLLGQPVEAALAATLLFRGFSLWLPLVPGFLISQHELRAAARSRPEGSGTDAA
ncbi:MAG: lysylphosphatidylglycerol synthase transmembrane domain-containing protein [Amaricoccus sp.]